MVHASRNVRVTEKVRESLLFAQVVIDKVGILWSVTEATFRLCGADRNRDREIVRSAL